MLRIEAGSIITRKFIFGKTARLLLAGSTVFGSGCASGVIAPASSPDNATSISQSIPLSTSTKEPTIILLTPTVPPTILPSATPEPTATVPPMPTVLIPRTPTRIPTLTQPEATVVTIPQIWQDSRNYSYWGPLRGVAEGNPRAVGQPSIYEAASVYDRYAAQMGKRSDLEQQVRNFADWYYKTAKANGVPQSYLDTAGFCSGVAKAIASGEKEPFEGKVSRADKILILALWHSQDGKYKPGKTQLNKDLAEKGILYVSDTATAEGGSWTRVILKAEPEKGIVWASDFGREPIAMKIADMKDAEVYVPVPPGRQGNYPAGTVYPSALDPEYRDKSTFKMERAVVDDILSR